MAHPCPPDHPSTSTSHDETWDSALLRRYTMPSPYSPGVQDGPSAAYPLTAPPMDERRRSSSSSLSFPLAREPSLREHSYPLKSRGKNRAFLTIQRSRASTDKDSPRFYRGEEVSGKIAMTTEDRSSIQKITVALQEFEGNQSHATVQITRQMTPSEIDYSLAKHDIIEWPFSITPSDSFDLQHPTANHERRYNVVATLYRRGHLNPNVVLTQRIEFDDPPQPPEYMSPISIRETISLPSVSEHELAPRPPSPPSPPSPITIRPWKEIQYPTFFIRGTLYHSQAIVYECVLTAPESYPVSNTIPLKMTLTSTHEQAIDTVTGAPSNAIEVRMYKVLAHGQDATRLRHRTLAQRDSFHNTTQVGTARWHLGGPTIVLPPDASNPVPRYSVDFVGELVVSRDQNIPPSVSFPGFSIRYSISVYPIRATGFVPIARPNTELFTVYLPLTRAAPPTPPAASA